MVNTYTSSLTPPPLPPRPGVQRPTANRTGPHLWCLSLGFAVQTVVVVVLFIYLFQRSNAARNENTAFHEDLQVLKRVEECNANSADREFQLGCKRTFDKFRKVILMLSQNDEKAESLTGGNSDTGPVALAQMKAKHTEQSAPHILHWEPSSLRNVSHLTLKGKLQIKVPGDYYVFSQVTFSKRHPKIPLLQTIMRQRGSSETVEEDLLLKAFCSPTNEETCTSYHGGVFRLEEEHKLYVNVTDLSLVNFDSTVTAFGLFLLQPAH